MRSFVVRQNDERKTMKIITTVAEMKAQVAEWKAEGLTIGLTPTMGALHEGHMSLMERAVKECDRVVTSVFVNPIQFGPNEDYDNYPRDLEHDAAIAESKGVNVVFHPEPEEMYPKNYNTYVVMETLTDTLCGAKRPATSAAYARLLTSCSTSCSPTRHSSARRMPSSLPSSSAWLPTST